MYGARPLGSFIGLSTLLANVKAGGTFAKYDLVMWQGSTIGQADGQVIIATAGAGRIYGVALEAGTDNETGLQVDITPAMVVLMDNDNNANTFDATMEGQKADCIGATGAMLVDTSSHAVGSAELHCLQYNPKGYGMDSDTSIGKYLIHERDVLF
jgi:hypothetical protein